MRGGTVFDGTGAPGVRADVGLRAGVVAAVSPTPLPVSADTRVIEAEGRWVTPGFVDTHTHYDVEVLASPGLGESVRHGVTTVLVGNCSISGVYSGTVDVADLFSRVEALPRDSVLEVLEEKKTWSDPAAWRRAVEALPLGPNVASFLGHSDVRASVMGLGRATDPEHSPSREELREIDRRVTAALDEGFLGVSTMTNPWDKMDGDRYRSRTLPSTHASWKEFRRLSRILRRRDRVLQGVPNLNTKVDVAFYAATSTGIFRKPLRVSLLAAADTLAEPWVNRIFRPIAWAANTAGRGKFVWQHLPTAFKVWADGIDLVVFEEFGSGREALHLVDEMARTDLLDQESYRRWFRQDFEKRFSPRVWHRDFDDALIVACPDETLVGQTVGDVARARKLHPADAFLDLVVEHGADLRWTTTIANSRAKVADRLARTPGITIGFSDAGAHLRNMAFYNFGVRLLERVNDAQKSAKPFLRVEEAVHKLTGELADFYRLDAGRLQVGCRADLVVIDPAGLDGESLDYHEEAMAEFGGIRRMVNRNDRAVAATIIGGRVVWADGEFAPGYGSEFGAGRFLPSGETVGPRPARAPQPAAEVR
ncbi:N-acyl-D-amino-acid deacylase family protein [Rhodococcus sp. IEGM 1408]|uniref:N-acyl-D-amino-acid deacylase family protein n=1 Tax=Rhodococcus sp. IEGM 1408 TaxID=3082220 RepID=UPI002952F38D|nr:amidohydrolase family protein [Rhodococcus sp. IEGM 1408]MDV7999857.1 amidohydrolase family protein [Rhodococcus sp. IEGM 1408]